MKKVLILLLIGFLVITACDPSSTTENPPESKETKVTFLIDNGTDKTVSAGESISLNWSIENPPETQECFLYTDIEGPTPFERETVDCVSSTTKEPQKSTKYTFQARAIQQDFLDEAIVIEVDSDVRISFKVDNVENLSGKTIDQGDKVLLSWVAENAQGCRLVASPDPSNAGELPVNCSSSFEASPDESTVYTFGALKRDNSGWVDVNTFIQVKAQDGNVLPVSNNDAFSLDKGETLTMAAPGVLANDTDENNDPLTAELVSSSSFGNLTLNADGSFNYEHNDSDNLSDSFSYRVSDGQGFSQEAIVSLSIQSDPDKAFEYKVGTYKFDETAVGGVRSFSSLHYFNPFIIDSKGPLESDVVIKLSNPTFEEERTFNQNDRWIVFGDNEDAVFGTYEACATFQELASCETDTLDASDQLEFPQNLQAVASGNEIKITWDAVPGAIEYFINAPGVGSLSTEDTSAILSSSSSIKPDQQVYFYALSWKFSKPRTEAHFSERVNTSGYAIIVSQP